MNLKLVGYFSNNLRRFGTILNNMTLKHADIKNLPEEGFGTILNNMTLKPSIC